MVRVRQFQGITATRFESNVSLIDKVENVVLNMNSGTRILCGFAVLFSGLWAVALSREQFVISAVFGFSLLLSLAAEALWLLGEKRKKHPNQSRLH